MNNNQQNAGSWSPPADFESRTSALDGISVYAPRQEVVNVAGPVTYNCPRCGAVTRFDIAASGVACEHCGYVAQVQTEKVGQRAEESEFTLETLAQAEKGWGITRQAVFCDNCGAVLTIPENALTATCPFCASNKVNIRSAPSDQLRPRFIIPFKILPDAVRVRAKEWLKQGWFHPDELSSTAILDRFTGIYMPFWTFDANITSLWKAEVGHERQESYYDASNKTWKTRTVIDWRWEDGEVPIAIDDLLSPGSTHISSHIVQQVYPFRLTELVSYAPDFLAGWQAHGFNINLPKAWEDAKAEMREKARQACLASISSHHVRNFSMNADFADETWRFILLPVYLAAYKFDGKVYQVMSNGQSGTIGGQKPVAWWKVWLTIAALLAPGIIIGIISLPLLLAAGIGLIPLFIGFVLLFIGGIFSVKIYKQAVNSEAA